MNLRYLLGAAFTIPLLPIMYFQGKKIKSSVPKLPEAIGNHGIASYHECKDQLKVLLIGESTMSGVGVRTHEEGFAGTFARELSNELKTNVDWKVYAKSGYTAQKVREKLIPAISDQYADLIIVGLGGNDAFELSNPDKWKRDIQGIIDDLKTKFIGTPILFANMPPIKEFPAFTDLIKFTIGNLVEILGKELNVLIQNQDKVYYSSEIITIDGWVKKMNIKADTSDFFSDGVHPSKLTYQEWAKDLAQFAITQKVIEN